MDNENIDFSVALTALYFITKEQDCKTCIHRSVCKHDRKPEYCYDYMINRSGGTEDGN